MDHLRGAHEVAVDEQGSHVDAEAGQKSQGVHVRQGLLLARGDQDDDGEEDGVGDVDAVEGLTPVGGDDPVKAVAVGHPLDEFAGGHERGVHRHDQGKAGQGRDR